MAKKKPKSGNSNLNPAFDSRMLSIGSPGQKPLRRGWIKTDDSTLSNAVTLPDFNNPLADPFADPSTMGQTVRTGGISGRVNFLYNPSEVSVSHTANLNAASQDEVAAAQSAGLSASEGVYPLASLGTMNLSLLFDRTYEVWDKSYRNQLVGQWGAYADVLGFYKLFGMVTNNDLSGPMVGPVAPGDVRGQTTVFNLFPSQFLGYPIIYVYLGSASLKFHGAVTGLNITYTHWSRSMVPIRAEVDLSLMMTPDTQSLGAGRGGAVNSLGGPTPAPSTSGGSTTSTPPAGGHLGGLTLPPVGVLP